MNDLLAVLFGLVSGIVIATVYVVTRSLEVTGVTAVVIMGAALAYFVGRIRRQ